MKNKYSLPSLVFAIISIFTYQLIIFQLLAIAFGFMAKNKSKENAIISVSWQYNVAIWIGLIYLIVAIVTYTGILN